MRNLTRDNFNIEIHSEARSRQRWLCLSSDAALKQKLLGYWANPRKAYVYKSDGIQYMCGGTSKSPWNIKGGVYYEEIAPGVMGPYDIITLTDKLFVFRSRGSNQQTFTLKKITKQEAAKYECP